MTHDDKMKQLEGIFNKCLEIADAKGRDYSGTTDGMGNFRDFGWRGIVVRLGDKYHRIKNLIMNQGMTRAVHDESIDDTLRDLINYAALALVMRVIEQGGAAE